MDLWIRSQDYGLYKIVGFKPPLCCDDTKLDEKYAIIGICYEYRMLELGIYKTKERALEVLDEIQKYLRYSKNADINNSDFLKFLNTQCNQEKCNTILNNIAVYEMPEE